MENFEYWAPTDYHFGKGVEDKAGQLTAKWLGTRILVVYGQGSVVRSGLLDRVRKSLKEAGIEFGELSGIQPNPTTPPVRECTE